ncbi:Ig-like domain-containing protein [Croceivirga thetidis]|uniref:SbsA Ig-like domain-containing protein n=1 Tax=Croceivirga thetidis TaxID=2721623 RepID=A0ABX1GNI5_9FLAO|nr:Ig-like domain-containing protein [Croceivirga thetidis]NKI31468.1 hypothetical protein [Croceivirga thetidis]
MLLFKRIFSLVFILFFVIALINCARRGTPSGGPKDIDPPVLLRAEPENLSINFDAKTIKLYFDEFVTLKDVQNQLIVSPPLKYIPDIKPQGGPSKNVEITFKDTLRANTTYTLNFGQSIVDNNENNPLSFFTYTFSTGDYLDSLTLSGAIKDAFNRKADEFVSVMLYEIDSAYNDSTIYKYPPNYITNTLDSLPIFDLKNLKKGKYKLFAMKDESKNNVFDQNADKIGFLEDTITLPTDSVYLLSLFKEVPDYRASVPSFEAKNRILFGFTSLDSTLEINTISELPDSVRTKQLKVEDKDSINYWLTPTDLDSILFVVKNETAKALDTFNVKSRKLPLDTLLISSSHQRSLAFEESFWISASTPIQNVDTTRIGIFDKDTLKVPYALKLDTIKNKVDFDFEVLDNQNYLISMLPGAIEDFFGEQNDTLVYNLSTGSYADYGNLSFSVSGAVEYPIIVQLTNEKGELQRELYAEEPKLLEFNNLKVGNYAVRVIFDSNGNKMWDTGNYLKKMQPERIVHFPDIIEMRANWENNQSFVITN